MRSIGSNFSPRSRLAIMLATMVFMSLSDI
jgi:hypothetical protein